MERFRFLTAGESHGRGLVAIVEGMVAGLPLEEDHINRQLKRRQQGYGRGPRMKIEDDSAEIISGVRYGRTTGSPVSLFIANRDWENWRQQMNVAPSDEEAEPVTHPRPGHADLAGLTKYGVKDVRPIIERASARETAARVAVGAVARRFLEEFGIALHSRTVAIGNVGEASRLCKDKSCDELPVDWRGVESSPVRCADAALEKAMMAAIDDAREGGDTLGGVVEVIAAGVPVGLGSHVSWDRRLDGDIARAIMSINAVKGVEIGAGFALA
ncbi:MAG: chorismate synthase, partial [Dehalococcoidia bacterium]